MITDGDAKADLVRLPGAEIVETFALLPPRIASSSGKDLVVYSADVNKGGYRIDDENVLSFKPGFPEGNPIVAGAVDKWERVKGLGA